MIFSFFLLFLFVSSFTIYFLFRHGKRVLPPGNFCFPLVGESLQLIWAYKTEDPEPFIDQRVARYGKIFRTHLFGESTIFSADAEVNKFMLQNEGKLFESSYPTSISNLLGKHSLLLMKDGLHKRMHSLTMSFASSCIIRDHFLLHIDRLIRINMESWSGRIYLQDEAKRVTFDLMVKQLMSFEPGEWNEKLRKEYHLLIEGFFSVPLPLFFTSYGRAIKARAKVAEALRVIVKQRKEENGEINEKKNDMLGALIQSEEGFSVEELIDFLLALLVAGYETTPIAITFAVKFLTETPAALALLKEEYEKILSTKMSESEGLEWNDYKSNMPFTQCVINETLRVGNIVSGFFRRAMTDVHIKGYTIPKDWKIFASFRAVHLDQDNYNDARTFNPWRWQENPLSSFTSSSSNIFTPFGGGSRLCPGYELARVEISVFLYHLVTRFSWVVAEEDKLVFFPTTRTMKRYPIIVKSRKGGSI